MMNTVVGWRDHDMLEGTNPVYVPGTRPELVDQVLGAEANGKQSAQAADTAKLVPFDGISNTLIIAPASGTVEPFQNNQYDETGGWRKG